MAVSHGTQRRYVDGCRCEECREAHRVSAREYRERRASGQTGQVVVPSVVELGGPGPVESGVEAEIEGLAETRPGLAQAALAMARILDAMARILDNPTAVGQQPAAAKVLGTMLDKLRSASAQGRRGRLAVVRALTDKGGADGYMAARF
jgi:hypothetical protein